MKRKLFQRGFSSIVVVISGLALIGLMGLGIDLGWGLLTAHQLQNAADAGALAGAETLQNSISTTLQATYAYEAQVAAYNAAYANSAGNQPVRLKLNPDNTTAWSSDNSTGSDAVVGSWNSNTHTFTQTLGNPNAVEVLARRTSDSLNGALPLYFGQVFGVSSINVWRSAVAVNSAPNGIITLAPTGAGALDLSSASALVKVENGSIYVNSNDSNAVASNKNSNFTSAALYIVGNEPTVTGYSGGPVVSDVKTLADPIVAAGIPLPPQPAQADTAGDANTDGKPLDPGYYPNGISLSHVLASGIYWIDGGINLANSNAGILDGTSGVLLFVNTGAIDMKGGAGQLNLAPMTTGTYANISLWQASTDTSPDTLYGTPNYNGSGLFYLPGAAVTVYGNGSILANMLISNTIKVAGSGNIYINYNGLFPSNSPYPYLVH